MDLKESKSPEFISLSSIAETIVAPEEQEEEPEPEPEPEQAKVEQNSRKNSLCKQILMYATTTIIALCSAVILASLVSVLNTKLKDPQLEQQEEEEEATAAVATEEEESVMTQEMKNKLAMEAIRKIGQLLQKSINRLVASLYLEEVWPRRRR